MVLDKERSILLGDSSVTIINVLELLSKGSSYDAIIKANPELTYADIMAATGHAARLISEHLIVENEVRVGAQIKLVVANRKLIDLEKVRKEHPRAYEPWADDEQNRLVSMFKARESRGSISKALGRNVGAIEARLVKLGLMERKTKSG